MDEMIDNKQKTIYGKVQSSINHIFPASVSKSSFSKNDSVVDIDSGEKESNNHENTDFEVSREFCKLEFQRNLKRKLADLKSRNHYNDEEFSFKPKFQNHNSLIKDGIFNENCSNVGTNNQEENKLKTNYRTLSDVEDVRKRNECVLSPQNTLNNSGFLSLSRQSLNESVNESRISSTASRIAANLLNKTSSKPTEISNKTVENLSSNCFSMKTRRYRTVVKRDKFSSYLTRVPKEDNLFTVPTVGTSNISINLNFSEESTKRIDFSHAHKLHAQTNQSIKPSIDSNVYWACGNCNSSNPSNFNFCPTCSTSNPKFALNEKNFQSLSNDEKNVWICSRCSTKNENCRFVCVFCFKNKNDSIKRPKLDEEQSIIQQVDLSKKFDFIGNNSEKMDFNFGSCNKTVHVAAKWSCECCLVENSGESESCVCCNTSNPSSNSARNNQQKFVFGSSNDRNESSILFGAPKSEEPDKEKKSNSKWNCSVCLAENEAESAKCVCCCANNPNQRDSQPLKSNFMFGDSKISSENPVIKFGSSTDLIDKSSSTFVFGGSQSIKSNFVFGKQVLVSSGTAGTKWSCSECWVENEAGTEKCVCCASRNPSSNITPTAIKFGNDSVVQENAGALETSKVPFVASAVDKKWNCSECWAENDVDKDKCACCSTKKNPAVSKKDLVQFGSISSSPALSNGEPKQSIQIQFGSSLPINPTSESAGKSSFVFGSSRNAEKTPQIFPFQFGSNANSAGTQQSVPVAPVTPLQNGVGTGPIAFGNGPTAFGTAPKTAKWGCPTCLVENDQSLDCCVCCQTRNPKVPTEAAKVPQLFSFHKEQSRPTFKFGSNSEPSAIENGCKTQKIDKPAAAFSSSLSDSDWPLQFTFSAPLSLPATVSTEVPVDLVFEFSAPQFL